jgi:hypothetical protein
MLRKLCGRELFGKSRERRENMKEEEVGDEKID